MKAHSPWGMPRPDQLLENVFAGKVAFLVALGAVRGLVVDANSWDPSIDKTEPGVEIQDVGCIVQYGVGVSIHH